VARFDLGVSDEEFWRLPERRLRALFRRQEQQAKREDWRFAWLGAVMVNVLGGSKKPVEPGDLMPWLEEKKKVSTTEEMLRMLKVSFPSAEKK